MDNTIFEKRLSIIKILQTSWGMYKNNFLLISLFTFIAYFPINLILFSKTTPSLFEEPAQYYKHFQFNAALELILGIITTIAIAFVVKSIIEKQSLSFGTILKKTATKWPAVVGTKILMNLWVGLYFLLIIPGIMFMIYWLFAIYAVIFKKIYFKEAMDYSKNIVRGRWGIVFLYSIIFTGLYILSAGIFGALFSITDIYFIDNLFITALSDTCVNILLSFYSVVFVIFFINFDKTKKEKISG